MGELMDAAKAAVIERIDDLIMALAMYEDHNGRRVDLIVRPDASYCLMGECETSALFNVDEPDCFEGIVECGSLAELMDVLTGVVGGAHAREEVSERDYEDGEPGADGSLNYKFLWRDGQGKGWLGK